MSGQNCSTGSNDSEPPNGCPSASDQGKVPISSVEKVAAFSIVYGVIFLVAVVVYETKKHECRHILLASGIFIVVKLICGNVLVCIVVFKRKDMRTVTNLFLLNMALSDILSAVFGIPVLLAMEISPNYWPLGGFMCRATRVISSISVSVSVYTMVVLALERYQAIVNPFDVRASRKTYRKTIIVMAITWLVSCAISAPQAFVATIIDIAPFKYCSEDWTGKGGLEGNRAYTVVAFILLFVIPIVVICGSYVIIIRTLWQPEPVLGEEESGSPTSEGRNSHRIYKVHRAKKKRKTTYMLLTVIVAFLVCMLPFQVYILVSVFLQSVPDGYVLLGKIVTVLAICSMACNPFIYSFFSEKFRKAFMDVFKCQCKADSQQATTTSIVLVSSTVLQK